MINQQTIFFIHSVVSVNRKIAGYNKYLLVITVVGVFTARRHASAVCAIVVHSVLPVCHKSVFY